MKAEFYKDMPMADYQAARNFVSKSMLSKFADCPARFKHQFLDGNEPEKTASLRKGNAVHTLALEPELWKANFRVMPATYHNPKGEEMPWKNDMRMRIVQDEFDAAGWEREEKDGKVSYKPTARSKTILTKSEYEEIEGMANALAKNVFACALLKKPGYVEGSIFWDKQHEDPETGEITTVKKRCRPDFMDNDGVLVDLKIARSVKPQVFWSDAHKLLYDISVAMSFEGFEALQGKEPDNYVFVVVEQEAPHFVECFESTKPMNEMLGTSYLEYGRARLDALIRRYIAATKSGLWPQYQTEIGTMSIPEWAMREFVEKGI